jgi:signal transduction histidine kinase
LIDDDAVDRMAVRRALDASDLNYELVEAATGAEGLSRAQEAAFDCVLLDYRLPDIDAFDLLGGLLAPTGGRQAVMMLTGERDPEVALRLMRAGALDHLAKAELTPPSLARAIRYAKARRGFLGELEAAHRDAEAKSIELDALNRQKSLLLSIIAHDLRNPFQALLGLSEMLSTAVASRDHASIERRAQGIKQAAERAHSLMESLFSWTAIQMDSIDVVLTDVDLDQVVGEAASGCLASARAKGVALEVRCRGLHVKSNHEMLSAILRNLVSNSIKFTPAGGRVDVLARKDGGVLIEVADTGVGMPAETVESLFRLDRRTTTLGTAGERGSGLGLLLCGDLAARLGTELRVTSVLGGGSTFSMLLPAG